MSQASFVLSNFLRASCLDGCMLMHEPIVNLCILRAWCHIKTDNIFSQENDLLRDIFDLGPQVKPTEVHKTSRYQRVSVENILDNYVKGKES